MSIKFGKLRVGEVFLINSNNCVKLSNNLAEDDNGNTIYLCYSDLVYA